MAKKVDFWSDYADCVRREGIPEGQIDALHGPLIEKVRAAIRVKH